MSADVLVERVAKALHAFDCGCRDYHESSAPAVDDPYYFDAARAVLAVIQSPTGAPFPPVSVGVAADGTGVTGPLSSRVPVVSPDPSAATTSVEEMAPGTWVDCPVCEGLGIDFANDPAACGRCGGSGNATAPDSSVLSRPVGVPADAVDGNPPREGYSTGPVPLHDAELDGAGVYQCTPACPSCAAITTKHGPTT